MGFRSLPMIEGEHIFLSYYSGEADFALRLAADLKNAGVHIWMDRLDRIKAGDDWRHAIEEAVNNCAAMVAVLSPDYTTSAYCRNELARADALKHPIFPVLLRPVRAQEWPIELQRKQYVDFHNWLDEPDYLRQFEKLLNDIRRRAVAQIGTIPDPEARYLTSLIAGLKARKGVLEYVELGAQTDALDEEPARPRPRAEEWGLDPEFALLEETPQRENQPGPSREQRKVRL